MNDILGNQYRLMMINTIKKWYEDYIADSNKIITDEVVEGDITWTLHKRGEQLVRIDKRWLLNKKVSTRSYFLKNKTPYFILESSKVYSKLDTVVLNEARIYWLQGTIHRYLSKTDERPQGSSTDLSDVNNSPASEEQRKNMEDSFAQQLFIDLSYIENITGISGLSPSTH